MNKTTLSKLNRNYFSFFTNSFSIILFIIIEYWVEEDEFGSGFKRKIDNSFAIFKYSGFNFGNLLSIIIWVGHGLLEKKIWI